jgi:hypothetical protein
MKDAVESLLEDVQGKIKVSLNPAPGAGVQIMMDNYDNFKPSSAGADILIHYVDSDPVGGSEVREEVSFDVYLFVRRYKGELGIFRYISAIKNALHNYRSQYASSKVRYKGNRFYNHKSGVWCYIISFSTTMLINDNEAG